MSTEPVTREIIVSSRWHNDGGSGLLVACACGWEQDFTDNQFGADGIASLEEINAAAEGHPHSPAAPAQGGGPDE